MMIGAVVTVNDNNGAAWTTATAQAYHKAHEAALAPQA